MRNVVKRLITKKEVAISVGVLIVAILVTVLLTKFATYKCMEFSEIACDPVTVLGGRTMTGIYSNIGVSMWGMSSVLYLAVWYYVKKYGKSKLEQRLCIGLGIVSGLLYLDDFLMIHEKIVRDAFHIPEESMMLLYFISVIVIVSIYIRKIDVDGLIYIVLSFGFLGLSAVVDVIHIYVEIPYLLYIEEGSKFVGICFWLAFSLSFTQLILRRNASTTVEINHVNL